MADAIPPKQVVIDKVLGEMPELDRAPFLEYLEHKARQVADLPLLREFRLYRQRHHLNP